MDDKKRKQLQLDCLYEMFRDKIEENVVYIVYSENEGRLDTTIDQLMSIASCSFTGYHFEPKPLRRCNNEKIEENNLKLYQLSQGSKNIAQTNRNTNHELENSAKLKEQKVNIDDLEEEEEDEAGLSINQRLERLQKSIDDLLLEKKMSHEKASQYLTRKMYSVTSYYSEMSSQLRVLIEAKTSKLVDLLLEKCKDSDNIDLHGLNPVQARLVVSELLKVRQSKLLIDRQGEASIDIITGWGKHSSTHGHRIKPTIVALLREKGFKYQRLNRGALRVTVTCQDCHQK